jgi:hypothetical protein
VVATGVDEHRSARAQRLLGVGRRGGHGAELAQEAQPGHRQHEVVGELVEAPLDAEVRAEGEGEDRGVGRQVAAGVVAHEQHRPLLGDVAQAANLAAEVEARKQPQARQRLADVVGIALVEVGRRHAAHDLGRERPGQALGERAARARLGALLVLAAQAPVADRVGAVAVARRGGGAHGRADHRVRLAMAERFEAVVGTEGSGTFVEVPLDVPAIFGRVRAPVRVTINGWTWRSTVMRYGERYYLPLNARNREGAGVAAGDRVEVVLELDAELRDVPVPADLADALAAAGLRDAWDACSYSHRREWVEAIESAKRPETRTRRVARAVTSVNS